MRFDRFLSPPEEKKMLFFSSRTKTKSRIYISTCLRYGPLLATSAIILDCRLAESAERLKRKYLIFAWNVIYGWFKYCIMLFQHFLNFQMSQPSFLNSLFPADRAGWQKTTNQRSCHYRLRAQVRSLAGGSTFATRRATTRISTRLATQIASEQRCYRPWKGKLWGWWLVSGDLQLIIIASTNMLLMADGNKRMSIGGCRLAVSLFLLLTAFRRRIK